MLHRDFFNSDFFEDRWQRDFFNMQNTFQRMDSLRNQFLRESFPELMNEEKQEGK